MGERRWPLVAAALVAVVALVAGAWAIGRASAPSKPAAGGTAAPRGGDPVRIIGGVPVGVEHSRAGALAAADNYVATSSETVIQDPDRYQRFVRTVYTSGAVAGALRDGQRIREQSPGAVANYAQGGRAVAIIGARKLESYDGARASVLTWAGGFVWGPRQKPSQRWFLVRTRLVWDGQRWRVEALDQLDRPAPAPASVVVTGSDADQTSAFDRELGGMEAPIYGAGG